MATQATLAALRKRSSAAATRGVRRAGLHLVRPNWYPFDEEHLVAAKLEKLRKDAHLTDLELVSVRIQAVFRGFRARKYASRVFHRKVLVSKAAFIKVSTELKRYHLGWRYLSVHMVLYTLAILLAYFQFAAFIPSAYSQEYALLNSLDRVGQSAGFTYDEVSSVSGAVDFIKYMARELNNPDPYYMDERNVSDLCIFESCPSNLSEAIEECTAITKYSGFLDQYNRQQIGLVVMQNRRKLVPCKAAMRDIYQELDINHDDNSTSMCASEHSTSSTYHSQYASWYPEILTNFSLFKVNPFQFDSNLDSFLVAFDLGLLNIEEGFMECALTYLFDTVHWVDQMTSDLCAVMVVQNLNGEGRYGYMNLCFETDIGGLVTSKVIVHSAQPSSTSVRVGAIFLASIYALFVIVSAVFAFIKILRKVQCKVGRWKTKRTRAPCWLSILFDLSLSFLHGVVIVRFFQYETASDFTPFIGADMEDILIGVNKIVSFIQGVTFTRNIYAVLLIFMVIRTIQHLDFHPDTGIISRTLGRASSDIYSFVFVFLVLVLSYAYVGLLMYSPYGSAFSSFYESVKTLLFVSMGEFDDAMEIIFSTTIQIDSGVAQVYFWTYVFFTTLVLFNILLSIVVESFVTFQEHCRASPTITFRQSLLLALDILRYDMVYFYWPQFKLCIHSIRKDKGKQQTISKPEAVSALTTAHAAAVGTAGTTSTGVNPVITTGRVNFSSPSASSSLGYLEAVSMNLDTSLGNDQSPSTTSTEEEVNLHLPDLSSTNKASSNKTKPLVGSTRFSSNAEDDKSRIGSSEVSHTRDATMLFNSGTNMFDILQTPHRYLDRLAFLRYHLAGSVPTFALRQELEQVFSSRMSERLLWLLRARTEELRPSQAREEVDMFFTENASQIYIIDQLKRVGNRLDEITELQKRNSFAGATTVRSNEDQIHPTNDTQLRSRQSI